MLMIHPGLPTKGDLIKRKQGCRNGEAFTILLNQASCEDVDGFCISLPEPSSKVDPDILDSIEQLASDVELRRDRPWQPWQLTQCNMDPDMLRVARGQQHTAVSGGYFWNSETCYALKPK